MDTLGGKIRDPKYNVITFPWDFHVQDYVIQIVIIYLDFTDFIEIMSTLGNIYAIKDNSV